VKKLIKVHKVSQKEFSEYIGVHYNTVKSWIYFNRIPDADTAYDIASALGVSVEYLVRGNDGEAVKNRQMETLSRKTAAQNIMKMVKKIEKNVAVIG